MRIYTYFNEGKTKCYRVLWKYSLIIYIVKITGTNRYEYFDVWEKGLGKDNIVTNSSQFCFGVLAVQPTNQKRIQVLCSLMLVIIK